MSEEEVTLPSAETAIVVVDMQKDFCYEKGALFIGKSAKEIIPKVKELLERASLAEILTIFTQDWHEEDDEELNLWPKHCVKRSEGAEIVNELANFAEKSEIVRKHRYSAFFETDLEEILHRNGIKTLVIVGVATNICVMHTASDAFMRGFSVVVPHDCTATVGEYEQNYALYHIKKVLCGKVLPSDRILFT